MGLSFMLVPPVTFTMTSWSLWNWVVIGSCESPPSVFLFVRIVLAVLGPLHYKNIHFRISLGVFMKKHVLISLGVSANVLIDLIRASPHAFIILLLLTGRVLVALLESRELG